MAGARALWRANGLKEEQFGKPIIAIVNSFTQFVPGHVHLHEIGQQVKAEIEKLGCFAAEFNTIAIDDGIAMGHDGMLYSLPSRDIIADSVEYMVNAHKADAMVCISNCDKITPGMLMASMRLNIPTIFVSGGPMEAGELDNRHLDLIDAMIESADTSVSDERIAQVERNACPGCGCCSGMFTANSMNCLNEAIGLALPGNGTIVATHVGRTQLFRDAARQIVENAYKYYRDGDESVLPRSIATRQAFLNAMSLDIAMGGSTNTVLHLLAVAQEAEADTEPDAETNTDAASDYAAYWAGDWYGWHVVIDASEELQYLKDTAWDACARIRVREDTGTLTVWDTETDPGELLLRASVEFSPGTTDAGCMTADAGAYLGCDLTDGLLCDPGASEVQAFAHMILISGRAEDENGGWVRFRLYLRPWGMDWEDVRTGNTSGCLYRNMLPPDYDSWYAPLLAQGVTDMPDSFETAK